MGIINFLGFKDQPGSIPEFHLHIQQNVTQAVKRSTKRQKEVRYKIMVTMPLLKTSQFDNWK
jgi:hypothetical protein